MISTWQRSATKAVIWELIGVLILMILFGEIQKSMGYVLFRIITLFWWERAWKRIKWGKIAK